jgi:hypothetical protein
MLLHEHALHLKVLAQPLAVQRVDGDAASLAVLDGSHPPRRIAHEVLQVHAAPGLGAVAAHLRVEQVEVLLIYELHRQHLVEHDLTSADAGRHTAQ